LGLWPTVEKQDDEVRIKIRKIADKERTSLELEDRIHRIEQEKE
jgi:hypothetical protein